METVECFVCFEDAEYQGVVNGQHHWCCPECGHYAVIDDDRRDSLRRFVAVPALHDFFDDERAKGVERPVVTMELLEELTVS
ncbi:MAG: hypothetical protein AAF225_08465 [Pseudomonadota bacterium]